MGKQNHIRVIDDLTNRVRWAAGTLETILEDEHLDPPVIDAISSAKHHLDEVRQLVGGLPRVNGSALDALDLTFTVNGDEYTVLGALGELNETIPDGDIAKPLVAGLNRVLLGKAQAEYGAKGEAKVFADADGNGANARLLKAGDDELRAACLELAAEKHEDALDTVPDWLAKRAKAAGCTASLDEDGLLNIEITSNPDGIGIYGASLVEAGQFIQEQIQARAEDTAELGYDPDERDPFGRNMLLREGDHIEATALAEQAKTMVRIAIQHAQDPDSVRESLIALEAVDRTLERVEQLIDGAQLEANGPVEELSDRSDNLGARSDDEPGVDVEDALRHLSNVLRLVIVCSAALDGRYAEAKHDVKVTLGQDVEGAIYETAAALGCKRDSCGVVFP